MNVKTIALSILSVLAIGTPAMAQTMLPIEFVQAVGVEVILPDKCPEGLLGSFIPSKKLFVVCPEAFKSPQQLHETVYHEAFHVLQWYYNNNLNEFARDNCSIMSIATNAGYAESSNYTQDARKEFEWAARTCEDDYELLDNVFYNILNPI